MVPFNHPNPLRERLAQSPQSTETARLIESIQGTGEFRPSDLQKVLGTIRGIEVAPDGVPDWAKAKEENADKS